MLYVNYFQHKQNHIEKDQMRSGSRKVKLNRKEQIILLSKINKLWGGVNLKRDDKLYLCANNWLYKLSSPPHPPLLGKERGAGTQKVSLKLVLLQMFKIRPLLLSFFAIYLLLTTCTKDQLFKYVYHCNNFNIGMLSLFILIWEYARNISLNSNM